MARRKTHPGTIEKRGKAYRVRLHVGGKRHTFTKKNMTLAQVRRFAREKHAELQEDAEVFQGDGASFSDLVRRFEREHVSTLSRGSQIAYPKSLKPLKAFFVGVLGDPQVRTIHSGHFERYLSWRINHGPDGKPKEKPLSNRTREKDRAVARKMFEKAIKWRWVRHNPVAATDVPDVDERDPVILTQTEYDRLLTKCEHDPMLHLWVLTCGETGMRSRSEALTLRWENVDLAGGFIWIEGRNTKNSKGRWVPMTPRLNEAMKAHFASYRFGAHLPSPSPWVFHWLEDKGKGKAGGRVKEFRTDWLRAVKAAKLPEGFRMHDLRHRRVTTWLAEGGNVVHVKEAVGHSALATTMHYTHLVREHLRSLVEEPKDERERLKELAQ